MESIERDQDRVVIKNLKHMQRILVMTMRNFYADNCLSNAAALTYTTLFAIVPLLTVLYSILALFPSFQGVGVEIQKFVFSNFVPSSGKIVSDWLTSFSSQARNLTFIGVGFLVVTALLMLRTVDYAINDIFHTAGSRRPVASILLYWLVLTLGPLLLGFGFAATSYLTTVQFLDEAVLHLGVKGALLYVLPVVMNVVAFTLLYMAVPKRRVLFVHALVGGIFVGVTSTVARVSFTFTMQISPTYEFIYGAFAAVPIFLLWIFLSWLMVLLGAELVHAMGEPRGADSRSFSQLLTMIVILATFNKRFNNGQTTELENVQDDGWPVNQHNWEQVTAWLMKEGIVGRHPSGALVAARTFSQIQFADVVHQCPWGLPKNCELMALNLGLYPHWFTELVAEIEDLNRTRDQRLHGSLEERLADKKSDDKKSHNDQ